MKIFHLLKSHETSVMIFTGNHLELKRALDFVHDPSKSFVYFIEANRGELWEIHQDVVRLFHNFVASALTLVEHTRILINQQFVKEEIRVGYQSRVDNVFASDPLSGFVQDLRNYILHRGLPATAMHLRLLGQNPKRHVDTRVILNLDQMDDWDWNGRSKEYISSVPKELPLLDVVESYGNKVRGFHQWFVEWFSKIYEREIEELFTLDAQLFGRDGKQAEHP